MGSKTHPFCAHKSSRWAHLSEYLAESNSWGCLRIINPSQWKYLTISAQVRCSPLSTGLTRASFLTTIARILSKIPLSSKETVKTQRAFQTVAVPPTKATLVWLAEFAAHSPTVRAFATHMRICTMGTGDFKQSIKVRRKLDWEPTIGNNKQLITQY